MKMKNMTKAIFRTILALLIIAGACSPGVAQAVIVYTGASSGANNALPTNATAGPLTINKPVGTVAGQALIASIAARPSSMTVVVPAGWFAMTVTQQLAGGPSTLPGGMTLLTYYHIVGIAEPASYTWTFANMAGSGASYGGSAVGGLLAFSGIDTSTGNPINVWSQNLTASGLTHSTTSITPTLTNTMIVSSISYLSGDSFANPTGIAGITERLDQRAPAAVNAIGTTLQMSTAPWATATATGASQAVALSNADTGVGHLMALKPALIDPGITMTRSAPLTPGGSAFYTMTVTNYGINSEPGPISVVDTLPAGLSYASFSGAVWACGAVGQVVTCTRTGALASGASTAPLVLNVNVSAGASGTLTNTATVSGTGGDGNMANNTATDSYTLAADLALTMSSGTLNPGQNGTYTLDVSNIGTLTAPSPITITDTLPAGLSYVSGAGTGWVCSAVGQAVTCTRASSLAAGAAAGTLTLTVAVAQTAFAFTNTATVSNAADTNAANNSATVIYNVTADLSMTMTRGANLVPGTNATYTLNVTNAGPNTAPQPITISDTLPAGLTYVSGVGAGWACVVGPPVTCTRTGTLANGASSSLVLTVAVSAGASGTITNTATVSGTAVDSTPANNTATDGYTIPLSTYAYYKMDEASWTGAANEVLDSSGNNRNAASVGGATVTTMLAPASAPKGDTCRGGTIPLGTGVATQMGVNTPINPNALGLGNAGTISFWYKNNVAWTSAGNTNDRTLLDASGSSNTREFWLVLQQTGALQFALDNAVGTAQTVTGGVKAFAVGTWHHIAITWDFNAAVHTMSTYVDGALDGTRNNAAVTSATPNYSTFFVGDSKTTVYTNPNRGNSANGAIDEVRVYASALTAVQITADMNAAHTCAVAAPDHIRIEHDGVAISCVAEAVVVKACANPTCSTLYTSGVTGIFAAGSNSVAFAIPNGQSQTTVNIHLPTNSALADPQTVRLDANFVSPVPVDVASPYCSNSGGPLNSTTACDMSVSRAGFLFDVPHLTSGTASGTVNVSAVRSSDSSTCVPLFQNATRTVALWGDYQNPVSGTLPLQVNGSNIETTATPAYTSTYSLAFNNSGVATLTSVQYDDVGLMQLNARYVGSTANTPPDGGMIVTGSDTFAVRPHHFDLSGIQQTAAPNLANQAAANAAGNKFVMAGEPFTVTVTAKNSLGATTANYGQETTPESVRFVDTSLLSTDPNYADHGTLVTGLGLTNNPPVGGGFGDFGVNCAGFAGTAGTACSTDFTWNEVGIIKLTPSILSGNYLGVAGDTTGTQTGNVGRFYAAKFALSGGVIANRTDLAACPAPAGCGTFTYMGEQMSAVFNLTAKAVDGTTTLQNYSTANSFAKLNPLAAVIAGTGGQLVMGAVDSAATRTPFPPCGVAPAHPCLTPAQATAGTFASGIASITVPFTIYRDNANPAGPFAALDIAVAPQDSDGVNMAAYYDRDTVNVVAGAANHALVGPTQARYGRMKLSNAHGSELLPLPINVIAQYWDSTTTTYVTNAQDNHSSFPATLGVTGVTGSNYQKNLGSGETSVVTPPASVVFTGGVASYRLTAPGANNNGSVDMTVSVISAYLPSNTARATFGVYKGANEFIYLRENY